MQIDEQAGIIHGVSVISQGIAKGHSAVENEGETPVPLEIDEHTLSQVKDCADRKTKGVKVKADHGSGILATIGYLRNFVLEKGKVVADLYLLQSSGVKERLIEMAQTIPDEFGLSIAFEGQNEIADGVAKARCTNLLSADIVDMPAANPGGLFSAKCNSRVFLFSVPEVDKEEKAMPAETIVPDKAPEIQPEADPAVSFEARLAACEQKLAASEADKAEKEDMKDDSVAEPVKSEMAAEEAPKVEVEIETEKKDEEVQDEEKELSAIVDRAVITALSKLGVKPVQLSVDSSKEQPKATSLSIKDEFSQKATELGSKAKAWQWFAANKPESVKELSQVL